MPSDRQFEETLGIGGLSIDAQKSIAAVQAQAAAASLRNASSRLPTTAGQQHRIVETTLFVGELDVEVDNETLQQHFSSAKTAHVCRDHITGNSLGYAYITFNSQEECIDTLRNMNYSLINGRPCRLMLSGRDPSKRTITTTKGNGSIVVKNLPVVVDDKSLHDTFAQWGNVISCRVIKSPLDTIRCYGYVKYDTVNAANRAIDNVNGALLFGREIQVSHQLPKNDRDATLSDEPQQNTNTHSSKSRFTNIYVKNIATDVTEDDLKDLFSSFGNLSSILIQKDENNMSKGFGFVNFDSPADAEKAVNQLHDFEFHGKRLFVSRAQKKSEREDELRRQHEYQQSRPATTIENMTSSSTSGSHKPAKYQGINLYVKNLADEVDDETLREAFAPFGQITSAKVMRQDKNGPSKGYGFVCFTSSDEAAEAISRMNGQTIASKEIYVAFAQRKEDRRTLLETQLNQRSAQKSTSTIYPEHQQQQQRKLSTTDTTHHTPPPALSTSSVESSSTTMSCSSENHSQPPATIMTDEIEEQS